MNINLSLSLKLELFYILLAGGDASATLEHHHGLGTANDARHQLPAHFGRQQAASKIQDYSDSI